MSWRSLGKPTADPGEVTEGWYLEGPRVGGPNNSYMFTVDVMPIAHPDFAPAERMRRKIEAAVNKIMEDELGISDAVLRGVPPIPLDTAN